MRGSGGGSNRKPDGERVNRSGARNAAKPRVVNINSKSQPKLPARAGGWPDQTHKWWDMWGRSPLATQYTEGDWEELLSAARFHAIVWDDDQPITAQLKAGSELRQRMSNFGATPLDRQRLRIQLVFADEAEKDAEEKAEARSQSGSATRRRRGPLKDASAG